MVIEYEEKSWKLETGKLSWVFVGLVYKFKKFLFRIWTDFSYPNPNLIIIIPILHHLWTHSQKESIMKTFTFEDKEMRNPWLPRLSLMVILLIVHIIYFRFQISNATKVTYVQKCFCIQELKRKFAIWKILQEFVLGLIEKENGPEL